MMKSVNLIILLLLVTTSSTMAQRFSQPLGRMYDLDMQHQMLMDSSMHFSAVKPVLTPLGPLVTEKEKLPTKTWLKQHFFFDDFLKLSSDQHTITINPIFDFQRTFDRDIKNDEKIYFLNTRGFDIFGRLGKRIYFNSEFYENQARYPEYETKVIDWMHGTPGQGYAKGFKGNSGDPSGKDWAMVFGSISVDVNKYMTFTLGNGKNVVGSGYRSVILSDVSFNYPYIRSDFQFGNFYYYVLCAYLQSDYWIYFTRGDSHYKWGNYHILGWKPSPQFEISAIEGVMWKNTDKDGVYKYTPNMEMFAPILLLPTAIHGFNDDTRVQLGYDVNFSPIHNFKFYQQLNYQGSDSDNPDKDFWQFQVGLHFFDILFGLVPELNSHIQLEYNYANIQDGSSASDFWNYGYPLTTLSVVENTQNEIFLGFDLEYKRFAIDGRYQHCEWFDRHVINFRYFFNKKTKWNFYIQLNNRDASFNNVDYNNRFVQFGMQICPQNFYYDF